MVGKSFSFELRIVFCISVSTIPGAILIALILLSEPSVARHFAHISRPALATQYADQPETGFREAPEEM